jgi:hypothetical protein
MISRRSATRGALSVAPQPVSTVGTASKAAAMQQRRNAAPDSLARKGIFLFMAHMNSPAPASNSTTQTSATQKRRRWWLIAAALLLLLYILWQFPTWLAQAQVGAAYGARMGCSCRYVEGRGIDSCRRDAEPGMEMVRLTDVPEERAVEGSVPLLASRTARFEPGTGCVLEQ